MPRRSAGWVPKLTRIATGRGRVRFPNEPDQYFGSAGDWPARLKDPPEHIRRAYERAVSDWLARKAAGAPPRRSGGNESPLSRLAADYLALAKVRGPCGVLTVALGHLMSRCGARTPRTFTAADYRDLRDGLAGRLAAMTTRQYLWAVDRFLRWAGVPRSVREDIADLGPPPGGWGRPSKEVLPVEESIYLAVLDHVAPVVRAMMEVQKLTGMRPGELCRMTPGEVDRDADRKDVPPRSCCWLYKPGKHKKAHLGKDRRVWIGPRARRILAPWAEGKEPDEAIFPSQRKACFSVDGYEQAIELACVRAGVPKFTPNQLRHAAATALELSAQRGIRVPQSVLGHDRPEMTRRYSAALDEIARETMRQHG